MAHFECCFMRAPHWPAFSSPQLILERATSSVLQLLLVSSLLEIRLSTIWQSSCALVVLYEVIRHNKHVRRSCNRLLLDSSHSLLSRIAEGPAPEIRGRRILSLYHRTFICYCFLKLRQLRDLGWWSGFVDAFCRFDVLVDCTRLKEVAVFKCHDVELVYNIWLFSGLSFLRL